jgi:parallel beta-helix repeat protein
LLSLIVIAAGAFAAGFALSDRRTEPKEPVKAPESAGRGPEANRSGSSTDERNAAACDQVLGEGDPRTFIAQLGRGETGCLRGGVHEALAGATVEVPDVKLTSYPGETATLAGRLWIKQGADGAVVENLVLDGRNRESLPSPTVNANDVTVRGNDISNSHTAICLVIGDDRFGEATGTIVEDNRIHDCGLLPPTNRHHGIYVSHALDTTIRDNVIEGNADRGVQLYPDARGTSVIGNVIEGNGEGVLFGGDSDEASSGNLVAGNVIVDSNRRFNVESHWQGPVGTENVVRGNCVWMTRPGFSGSPPHSGIEDPLDGVRSHGNLVADPGRGGPGTGGPDRTREPGPCR